MTVGRNCRGYEEQIKHRPAPHNWALKNPLTMAFFFLTNSSKKFCIATIWEQY